VDKTVIEVAKELQKAYNSEWRRKNPEKVKNSRKNYWLRQAEKKLREQG